MNHIGSYDGMAVYEVSWKETLPKDTKNLYVDSKGKIWYGGVAIGLLDPHSYKVLKYDKELYRDAKRKEAEQAARAREKSVPVPKCVAETSTVGTEAVTSADEFFARLAKDIDDMLANAKDFAG